MPKAIRWLLAIGVFAVVILASGRLALCKFGWGLPSNRFVDFHLDYNDAPRRIYVTGRIGDAISVIKDVAVVIRPAGVMQIRVRAAFVGMPCATDSSMLDIVIPVPPEVHQIQFGEDQKIVWQR